MVRWSPYNYGFNNPIKFIDPDGKNPILIGIAVRYLATAILFGGVAYSVNNGIKLLQKNRNYEDSSSDGTKLAKPKLVGIKKDDGPKADDKSNKKEKKDNTYDRVKPRKGTLKEVDKAQPKNEEGIMIDPNTLEVLIPGKIDLGHKKGEEWRTRKQKHIDRGSTRKEVIDAENDPLIYQWEDRRSNRSHKNEKKD